MQSEDSCQIISLDIYRASGQQVNIADEPDECDEAFHRFKNIRLLNEEQIYCIKCAAKVVMQAHPSIGIPVYVTCR